MVRRLVEATPSEADALSRNNTKLALDELASKPEHPEKSPAATAVPLTPPPPQQKLFVQQALSGLVVALSLSTVLGYMPSHWSVIVACLWTTAALLLGLDNLRPLVLAYQARRDASWKRVPLTDAVYGQETLNKLANTAQVREKGLKILQYVLRGSAYCALFDKETSKHLKTLSKSTSVARRFFKFFRWVKHFEDLAEAKAEQGRVMRGLLFLRVAANFGADWAEDVCSLERVTILPKGTLSVEFMLFAEYCQLALALVEIFVTSVRAHKELELTTLAEAAPVDPSDRVSEKKLVAQQRKLALVRLELIKFVSDVGKALFDCELSFAHEGVFIGCSLFSGILSTHKNFFKIHK